MYIVTLEDNFGEHDFMTFCETITDLTNMLSHLDEKYNLVHVCEHCNVSFDWKDFIVKNPNIEYGT